MSWSHADVMAWDADQKRFIEDAIREKMEREATDARTVRTHD